MDNSSDRNLHPANIPFRTLASGARMPALGLGTFGSDRYGPADVARAVSEAIQLGVRHIDCAEVYGNEAQVGAVLGAALREGLRRDDLWVTSKLWNNHHAAADVIPACQQSLRSLGLETLDLYLVHWPFPNYHAPGVDVSSRDPHARPYIHEAFMHTWRQMERLVEMGLVRHIGTSNVTVPKLRLILRDAAIRPAVNEMELHPHFQQPELFDFVVQNGIVPVGYSPLGSPSRPARDRTPTDTVDMEDPLILEIAARRGLTPAQVCIRWGLDRGQAVIPFSARREQIAANLQAAAAAPLSPAEMQAIAAIDRGSRLIKGQVFLWPGARGWEDLWDEDGSISG